MSDAKNIIKRLVNSTDKLRVNVTELLKLIKTKQDKLPTDGSSEEFLAKDGQYHTVKSSTQSNWEQNDENADDYIKNRPFYKKSKLYTFPNADYITPYYSSEEDDMILYKIADEFVKPKTFEGSILTGHVKGGESESVEITSEGDDSILYEERDEETGELLLVVLSDTFVIFYEEVPILDGDDVVISVPPGVYLMLRFSSSPTIVILDSIELILDLKQIDKKFIPSDYATVDDVEGVSNQIQIAQNTANGARSTAQAAQSTANNAATKADQAQSTANNAATKADQAQSTANNAATKANQAQSTANAAQSTANNAATKANQAQSTANAAQSTANNAATKADQAQSTANNATEYIFNVLNITDASNLFYGNRFKKPPMTYLSSYIYNSTFFNCSNMTECGLSSMAYHPRTISAIFCGCKSLKIIRIYSNTSVTAFNLTNCTDTSIAFYNCVSLTTITAINNIKVSISFSQCPLDDETVNKILDALVAGTDPRTLTLRSDIVEKLTDDQLAKIPSNWTIQ